VNSAKTRDKAARTRQRECCQTMHSMTTHAVVARTTAAMCVMVTEVDRQKSAHFGGAKECRSLFAGRALSWTSLTTALEILAGRGGLPY